MKVKQDENFCRVFEMPEQYPQGFCFGGGKDVNFKMVDWFNPVPNDIMDDFSWEEWSTKLSAFIKGKTYYKKGRTYLVFTDFCQAIIIEEQL